MFGYIKPEIPDLRVRDNELYKACYCGLCRAMGSHICRGSRLSLSYDLVFLAIVRAAAAGDTIKIARKRCAAHPLKKRSYVECSPAFEYSARASAVLTYYKVVDDLNDDKGIKKLLRKLIRPSADRFRKKADLPELDLIIKEELDSLAAIEKEGGGAEECADCFGRALGKVFSHAFGDTQTERILDSFGFHIGRWIYFVDAADDLEKDDKKGCFNPFARFDPLPSEEIVMSTNLDLDAAKKALDLISVGNKHLYDIIENIIYIGMPGTAERILGKNVTKEGDK